MTPLVVAALFTVVSITGPVSQPRTTVFVGSTPCDEAVRRILEIPREANAELIEWELTLGQTAGARGPRDLPASLQVRTDSPQPARARRDSVDAHSQRHLAE